MNGLPYYKAYPRDFLEGTIGMPLELKGAYRVLLDLIYMQDGSLPDDPHYISGHLGCSVRKWKMLREKLIDAGKIYAFDGIISQKRARKELEITRKYQEQQSENRRGSNKNKDLEKPPSIHTDTDTDIKEPKGSFGRASAKKRSRLPTDWRLPKEWGEWALEQGLTDGEIRTEAAQFSDHHVAKGTSMIDWRRAWQTWVRNALKWRKQQPDIDGVQQAGAFGRLREFG